ncbi:Asp-tRNA(Asn)/Glu-tRNA(Gln) amidotransferase subunit GatA [Pyrolobus fumarii]
MLLSGELSVDEYVARIYEVIRKSECLNAFITLRKQEDVEKELRSVVERASRGDNLPLAGVLVAVKDNIVTKGLRTTCASRMLEEFIPPYNATVVERLVRAGAVILGKTNMDEFAMGSTSELSAYGPVGNPWCPSRVPGGSSGGSAVAAAIGAGGVALGSDTGGSIRLPAAWSGVYGLKPTYGLVSRYGLVAYADSLEQIGPLARHPRDIAMVMEVIAGFDERDSTTLRIGGWRELPSRPVRPRIAILRDLLEHPGVDERVAKVVEKMVYRLSESLGWDIGEVKLGSEILDLALPAYYVIAMSEASSNLARYTGILYGPPGRKIVDNVPWTRWFSEVRKLFGWEVKRRIFMGAFALSAGYRDALYEKALIIRRRVKDAVLRVLKNWDAVVLPSCVSPPPRKGEAIGDPLRMYALDLANVIANLAGVPALAVPAGTVDGLPVGAQLISQPLNDRLLVELAIEIEDHLHLYREPPEEPCKVKCGEADGE